MNKMLFLLIAVTCSCVKQNKETSLDISITYAQSYECNLTTGVYTVNNYSKEPIHIQFDLTNEEKSGLVDKYYELGLDKIERINPITGNTLIEDDCSIMPKLYTVVKINSKTKRQEFQIDNECEDFKDQSIKDAKSVKQFLDFVDKIIKSKPEIRKAPKSNIVYL